MAQSLIRLMVIIAFGSFSIVALLILGNVARSDEAWSSLFSPQRILLVCLATFATVVFYYALKKLVVFIDASALAQARFLDTLNAKYADAAILFSAALSLFVELAIIRWQSSVLPFFAFYKNFSLLACFVGLGLGYALATRHRIPLVIVLPLLAWQFSFMTIVRYVPGRALTIIPFSEQLGMGTDSRGLSSIIFLYGLLAIVFLLTALTFMPVGQLCGRLMERRTKLRAYGLNLLGSLLGVLLMLVASFLWTPPLAWFALCFLAILLFTFRTPSLMIVGISFTVVCTIVLAWPVNPLWNRIYSPYQLLEIGRDEETGLTNINAAGLYYQRTYDFSDVQSTRWSNVRGFYDFPYKAHPALANVAVVGAGTGNDVAAALRAGAGHVEAIEIDPAILLTGNLSHPEKPYSNARVHGVVNDARSFLRTTEQTFDLIVYGLLDSHTLLSQGSSVRLDSFVYTVEGLREARSRLKSDGMLSLSFCCFSDALGRKIYLMLQQAFDGRPPVCIKGGLDCWIIFLESNDGKWALPPKLVEDAGFTDQTLLFADPSLHADVSTDDWPFVYMPRRIYPVSYLIMVFEVLVLALLVFVNHFPERPKGSHLSFFFLGAGFMLIETKGITEMGLTFGNTWQVIGIVIAGILTMAFLGNCAVQWLDIKRPLAPYLFLFSALVVGWYVARSGGFASTPLGRLETSIVLTLPLLFSGIVFSTLLSSKGRVSGMIAMNLLGAICGGLLEYNSMYFGFRFLYLIAMGCYLLAFVSELVFPKKDSDELPVASTTIGPENVS
jgi:SAM-dependent methyltransferase